MLDESKDSVFTTINTSAFTTELNLLSVSDSRLSK
jgi:hypothetical protein